MISVVTTHKSDLSKEEALRKEYDKKIRAILKQYYETKYQTKVEENEEFLYHIDEEAFLKKLNYDMDAHKRPYCFSYQQKYYFNSRFFDENNHTFVKIYSQSKEKEVEVDDSYIEQFLEDGVLTIVDGHYVSNNPNFNPILHVKEDGTVVNIVHVYDTEELYILDEGMLERNNFNILNQDTQMKR